MTERAEVEPTAGTGTQAGHLPPSRWRRFMPEGSVARYVADELAMDSPALDRWIPIFLFVISLFVYAWLNHHRTAGLNYFVPLADAFLHGRLGLTSAPSYLNEVIPSGTGLFYVVYPPVPALVVLPAVLIVGPGFHQEWASIALGAANVALVFWIVSGMGARRRFALAMSLAFGFGTIVWFSAQVGTSWHFAHVVALFFMLLAICACQLDAPTAVIGLLFAGAFLSRLPMALALPFFVAYLAHRSVREHARAAEVFGALAPAGVAAEPRAVDPRRFVGLAVPMALGIAVPLAAYLVYNQLRFGSFAENGYALIPGLLQEVQYRHGFFSLYNIPRQLYAMFLTTPVQIGSFPWVQSRALGGLSILLTSPIFLWAIRARRPDWFGLGAWLSIALVLIPNLTHADPGGIQFGYRYAQDIYPFLLLLTVRGLAGRVGFEPGLAIAVGFVVNLWGMGSAYYDWWNH
jgi:hypothetical protein